MRTQTALYLSQLVTLCLGQKVGRPNILLFVVDDMGINDVSWNNPSADTPNLGSLASNGIILENAYSLPTCAPSRTAILTGRYPFKMGLQRGFGTFFPEGIPLGVPLLPEYLQPRGYRNHNLGKWHLGFCSEKYTPIGRGFDTFDGLYVSMKQYKKVRDMIKNKKQPMKLRNRRGLLKDKVKKTRLVKNRVKLESGYLKRTRFNTPVAKRKDESAMESKYPSYENKRSRPEEIQADYYVGKVKEILETHSDSDPFFIYLSFFTKFYNKFKEVNIKVDRPKILKAMDEAVGQITDLLKIANLYNNTIIFFISDNGGRAMPDGVTSPNFPMKEFKGSVYEGGTKVPSFIHSPLLDGPGQRYEGLFHSVDVVPTLLNAANISWNNSILDGISHWTSFQEGTSSPRTHMVYNIDDEVVPDRLNLPERNAAYQISVRKGPIKLVWGSPYILSRKYRNFKHRSENENLELFNLEDDPSEMKNIAAENPVLVEELKQFGLSNYELMVPPVVGYQNWVILPTTSSQHGSDPGWCVAVKQRRCEAGKSRRRSMENKNKENFLYGSLNNVTFECFTETVV